jgi:hypothetical protein
MYCKISIKNKLMPDEVIILRRVSKILKIENTSRLKTKK